MDNREYEIGPKVSQNQYIEKSKNWSWMFLRSVKNKSKINSDHQNKIDRLHYVKNGHRRFNIRRHRT